RVLPRAARRLQGSEVVRLHERDAARPEREALQAQAARSLLDRQGARDMSEEVLRAPHVLEYAYTRSVGPVIGRFFTGLRDQTIEGIKGARGQVMVPPVEYDPQTADALTEFVEVGQSGVVTTWAWVGEPRSNNPVQKPFAWALIKLDGADTAMLHVVDAGSEKHRKTGMRG